MKHFTTRLQTVTGQQVGPGAGHLPPGAAQPFIDVDRARVHSVEDMRICTRTFWADDVPGYRGERLHFKRGATWVVGDHPVIRAYADNFAEDGSPQALEARGYKASATERFRLRRDRKADKATPSGGFIAMRGGRPGGSTPPPWRLEQPAPKPSPQIRRPRAVTGDDIYDLRNVRTSVIDPEPAARELRDRALRAVERAKFPHARADQDGVRGHLAAVIDSFDPADARFTEHLLRSGSPAHRKLFAKFMQGAFLSDDEKRALSLTDSAHGKAVVPFTLDPSIVSTSSPRINPLRSIARTETTMTDEWKGVGSEGIEASYRAEGTESSDDAPKLTQLAVDTEGASAWIPFSYEIDQDWGSAEPQIAAILQRSKDDLEAEKLWSGSGEDEPFGLLTLLTEKLVETKDEGKLQAADIEALEAALPDGFLDAATWLGHRDTYATLRELEGVEWVKHPGSLPELNGITAMQLSTIDAAIEPEAQPLVVGDFSQFVIVDRIGVTMRRIEVMKNGRPTGETGYYAMWRNGTTVTTDDAFRVLLVGGEAEGE